MMTRNNHVLRSAEVDSEGEGLIMFFIQWYLRNDLNVWCTDILVFLFPDAGVANFEQIANSVSC